MAHLTLTAATLVLAVTAVPGRADAPLSRHFGAANNCYGRVYSPDHLAQHPAQKVTAMRLDHFPQYAGPFGADDQPLIYPGGDLVLYLSVRLRGSERGLENTGFCRPEGDHLTCGIECDGGQFELIDRGPDKILLRPKTEMYFNDCGESDIAIDPEPDDRSFLLTRLPAGDCQPPS